SKNNSELLVLVTPELVRPIPSSQPAPELQMPEQFMKGTRATAPRTPGMEVTGPVPVKPPQPSMPVEELVRLQKTPQAQAPTAMPYQLVPIPLQPQPQAQPAPAPPKSSGGSEQR
ncbi:MAG: type II and III secretion system protein, partial [Acidobacteria bacterium]